MPPHLGPGDQHLKAVAALDDFIAEIVGQARRAGIHVPGRLFDWAAGEGSWIVQRLAWRRLARCGAREGLDTALHCAVRYWVAPYLVAHFEMLQPLFPELHVRQDGRQLAVLVRTGRWRCAAHCHWRLCED